MVCFFTTALDVPFFLLMLASAGVVFSQARRRAAMRISDGALWVDGRELGRPRLEVRKIDDDESASFALFAISANEEAERLWGFNTEDDARWLMNWLTRLFAPHTARSTRPAIAVR